MYLFVLVWGPLVETAIDAASSGQANTPFGKIFSCFMCACMFGSSISTLSASIGLSVVARMGPMLVIAAASLYSAAQPDSTWMFLVGCFLVFEVAVGLYFPSIGALRSAYVPDEHRAIVLNFVRLPLNAIVVTVTFCRARIGNAGALKCSAAALSCALLLLAQLRSRKTKAT